MSLEAKLMADLKEAMKSKDEAAKRTIRAVKAAIMLQKTDGSGKEMTEEMEIKLVQKLSKQRQESLSIFMEQGRDDLAATEREEIEVLKKYLPEQMSEENLKKVIAEIVGKTGASGMKDMGKVMGMASKELAGRADGKTISAVVKSILAG